MLRLLANDEELVAGHVGAGHPLLLPFGPAHHDQAFVAWKGDGRDRMRPDRDALSDEGSCRQVSDHEIEISLRPFEIKTLLLEYHR